MWKLAIALLFLAGSSKGESLTISLFATDLTGCDVGSACDAVVTILCSSISSDWKECGKTKEMSDDNFPVWPELFVFNYTASEQLRWRFDVVDMDVAINDKIGSITLSAAEFLAATETITTMKHNLNDRGSFYVHRRTSQ